MPQCASKAVCSRDIDENLSGELCILHSKDPAKDKQAFTTALATHRQAKGDQFCDFVFPGEVDFFQATFAKEADFSGATFTEEADFSGATFTEQANFSGATFAKGANFSGATFAKKANLFGATFTEQANFLLATFAKEADFRQARFTERANFLQARFTEQANFFHATFAKEANFLGATFTEQANFFGTIFTEEANFYEVKFPKEATFTIAKFIKHASFVRATFTEEANFLGATFTEEANFLGATFTKEANFLEGRFLGMTCFVGTRFLEEANFREATFMKEADFSTATFAKGTTFILARFFGRALFVSVSSGEKVNFTQVAIQPPGTVIFLKVDLTRYQFQDTDLRQTQMVAVTWPQIGRLKVSRRTAVYDEILLGNAKKTRSMRRRALPWLQVEQLYRALKQNHEDRRDYERAGDFHYGEKEMRRQNPETSLGLRLFLTLYKLFSGYGERYLRPLLWAALIFVGSTVGYMWWGLRPKAATSSLALTNIWDWLRATHYSFRVMTFLKPEDWVPLGYAHVINTLQTLLGPAFLGFFALALRQRLKR